MQIAPEVMVESAENDRDRPAVTNAFSVVMSNLVPATGELDLHNWINRCDPKICYNKIKVAVKDQLYNECKGFAYVECSDTRSFQRIFKLHNTEWNNQKVQITADQNVSRERVRGQHNVERVVRLGRLFTPLTELQLQAFLERKGLSFTNMR